MEFVTTSDVITHNTRRKQIISVYPEIQELYGHEPMTKYIGIFLVIFQLILSTNYQSFNIYYQIIILYFISASISQALFLINHEISHNLVFKKYKHNVYFGIFVNIPALFPYSVKFREYHLDHHNYMGQVGLDTDIPTVFESLMLSTTIGRILWLTLQIIMYAIRPLCISPKNIDRYTLTNIIIQFSFNALFYHYYGIKPFLFLGLSLIIAGGFHPTAGHFISEHTLFNMDSCHIDTRSYYGILNKITFNVGYHNEHHDFTFVPWTRLPQLKNIAAEFYDLPECKSWIFTLLQFCFCTPIRVLRH